MSKPNNDSDNESEKPRALKLNNGELFPLVGLGTYKSVAGEAVTAVREAIRYGYRHIDTATVYQNEAAVAAGLHARIADGTVHREEMFITTKLWCTDTRPDLVKHTLKKSLSELGLQYVDLYLIHWPFSFPEGYGTFLPIGRDGKVLEANIDYVDTWKEMEKCQQAGLVKSLGVSNFNKRQLTRLLGFARIKPVTNQIECHPLFTQKHFIDYCKRQDIVVTAFSPLGNPQSQIAKKKPTILGHPLFQEIGRKHKKSAAQVILRYLIGLGVNPIPKSVNEKHIKENIDIFDFDLPDEDLRQIDKLNENMRTCVFESTKHLKEYPFNDEY